MILLAKPPSSLDDVGTTLEHPVAAGAADASQLGDYVGLLLDSDQCFSAQRESQRPLRRRSLFPSGRRRSRIPSPDRFGPPKPDRFGIRAPETLREMIDQRYAEQCWTISLEHHQRKGRSNGGSVREWRYHRTIPLRTHVCRYGEYESSKIRR
jgi:hypothetical protein